MSNQVTPECPKCHSRSVFKTSKGVGLCRSCFHKSDFDNFIIAGMPQGKEFSKHDYYERINN